MPEVNRQGFLIFFGSVFRRVPFDWRRWVCTFLLWNDLVTFKANLGWISGSEIKSFWKKFPATRRANLTPRWRRIRWVLNARSKERSQRFPIPFFSLILRRIWSGMDKFWGSKILDWVSTWVVELRRNTPVSTYSVVSSLVVSSLDSSMKKLKSIVLWEEDHVHNNVDMVRGEGREVEVTLCSLWNEQIILRQSWHRRWRSVSKWSLCPYRSLVRGSM